MSSALATEKDKEKKRKTKEKSKEKKSVSAADDGRGPDWAYKPPQGTILLNDILDSEEFDYDTLKENDDLELWVVRVPEGLKAKHLDGLILSVPPSASSSRIGSLQKKHASYDIWSIRDDDGSNENRAEMIGGDEVLGLTCLLPRKKKGSKLAIAPAPVAHHVVVSIQPTLPTPPPSSPEQTDDRIPRNPERYRHPKHLLKHRFLPTGAEHGSDPSAEDAMELEPPAAAPPAIAPSTTEADAKSTSPKRSTAKDGSSAKKRKGEGDSPKKAKKAKTAT